MTNISFSINSNEVIKDIQIKINYADKEKNKSESLDTLFENNKIEIPKSVKALPDDIKLTIEPTEIPKDNSNNSSSAFKESY